MSDQYTSWDTVAGDPSETKWDDAPPDFTRWDVIPAELKIDQIARVAPAGWLAKVKER